MREKVCTLLRPTKGNNAKMVGKKNKQPRNSAKIHCSPERKGKKERACAHDRKNLLKITLGTLRKDKKSEGNKNMEKAISRSQCIVHRPNQPKAIRALKVCPTGKKGGEKLSSKITPRKRGGNPKEGGLERKALLSRKIIRPGSSFKR